MRHACLETESGKKKRDILLLSVLEYLAETKVTQEVMVRSSEVMLDSVQDEVRSCCLELFEGTLLELDLEKFYLPFKKSNRFRICFPIIELSYFRYSGDETSVSFQPLSISLNLLPTFEVRRVQP